MRESWTLLGHQKWRCVEISITRPLRLDVEEGRKILKLFKDRIWQECKSEPRLAVVLCSELESGGRQFRMLMKDREGIGDRERLVCNELARLKLLLQPSPAK